MGLQQPGQLPSAEALRSLTAEFGAAPTHVAALAKWDAPVMAVEALMGNESRLADDQLMPSD